MGQEVLTTFDLRMCAPNREPVMNTAELHTIEHLAATYLRNEPHWKEKVIYFGPMGCHTGCYLILAGDYQAQDAVPLVRDTFCFIAGYEGEIPGAAPKDCGNYLDQNLPMGAVPGQEVPGRGVGASHREEPALSRISPAKAPVFGNAKAPALFLVFRPRARLGPFVPSSKNRRGHLFFAEFPPETSI